MHMKIFTVLNEIAKINHANIYLHAAVYVYEQPTG